MKKIVSFALVFTILINILGFGIFDVRASAVMGLDDAIAAGIISLTSGFVLGGLSGLASDSVNGNMNKFFQNHEDLIWSINHDGIKNGEVIQIGYQPLSDGSYRYWLEPVDSLSGSDRAFIQKICDATPITDSMINGAKEYYQDGDAVGWNGFSFDARSYANMKNNVTNAVLEAAAEVAFSDALASEAWNSNYEFDWTTGGVPTINLPTSTEYVERIYDDYSISTGIRINSKGLFSSRPSNILGMNMNLGGNENTGYSYLLTGAQAYGFGSYLIYNGEIFYRAGIHQEQPYDVRISGSFGNGSLNQFVNSSGQNLLEVGCSDVGGLVGGFYLHNKPKSESNDTPIQVIASNLTEQTGGGEISMPLRDDENVIAQYIQSIGDPDSILQIAPDGSITGADGITIEQIQALLDDLANQLNTDIDLSSLEAYLQAIEKACRNTLTGEQLNQALKGIKSKIKDYSGDLSKILSAINGVKALDQTQTDKLTSIEEQTAAIAAALEAANELEFELEKDDIEVDYFSVEHTGLAEAKAFVDNYEVVDQLQRFMLNILDPDVYGDGAPNFKFYYDSNRDGEKEVYNALDLSFLDTPLSNENIADKRRFNKSMTVREFIQLLMILICYVAFAVKVLRKLPGLVSGGESAGGDGLEIKAIDRSNTLRSIGKGG